MDTEEKVDFVEEFLKSQIAEETPVEEEQVEEKPVDVEAQLNSAAKVLDDTDLINKEDVDSIKAALKDAFEAHAEEEDEGYLTAEISDILSEFAPEVEETDLAMLACDIIDASETVECDDCDDCKDCDEAKEDDSAKEEAEETEEKSEDEETKSEEAEAKVEDEESEDDKEEDEKESDDESKDDESEANVDDVDDNFWD